ncbi:MAG: hypothetical protein GDA53_05470 [Rhodobacteraceae bacterium]|nr:hypothetical protein [Paracoccaceae bacterium]
MPPDDHTILGKGVYTPAEAARLVRTTARQVLCWTSGSGRSAPLWRAHYRFLADDVKDVSFLDLVELRVVVAMRRAGVALQSIRYALSFAQDRLGIERPLASHAFKVEGTELLIEAAGRAGAFLESAGCAGGLVSLSKGSAGQSVFRGIIDQSLKDLEYDDNLAARWRPRGFRDVIIDPGRRFGAPILDEFGLSTGIIFKEYRAFRDIGYLASIYEIPARVLRAGIDFEADLDKAHGQGSA